MEYLKTIMAKTSTEAKNVKGRFMKENVMLLQEINELKKQRQFKLGELRHVALQKGNAGEPDRQEQRMQEYNMQHFIIEELKQQILELQSQNNQLKQRRPTNQRPLPLDATATNGDGFDSQMGDGIAGASQSEGAPDGDLAALQNAAQQEAVPEQ